MKTRKTNQDIINAYMKRMIKDLDDKIFKHYIYMKYYDIALDFVKDLKSEKTSNIIFSKELRISKK